MPYIRIKPLNKRLGHVLKRYKYENLRLREGAGWYPVTEEQAIYLRTIRMRPEDSFSPRAFDIVETVDDAREIEEKEEMAAFREQWGDAPIRFHSKMVAEAAAAEKAPTLNRVEEPKAAEPEPEPVKPKPKTKPKRAKTPRPVKPLSQPRSKARPPRADK